MERLATAIWRGGPGAGEGSVSTSSGILYNLLYTFGSTAAGEVPCTNPCEMLAAAVASCTSLMVAQELALAHVMPQQVRTQASVKLENLENGWTVTAVHLHVKGRVPETDQETWEKAVEVAQSKCPIGRALRAPITLSHELELTLTHAAS